MSTIIKKKFKTFLNVHFGMEINTALVAADGLQIQGLH